MNADQVVSKYLKENQRACARCSKVKKTNSFTFMYYGEEESFDICFLCELSFRYSGEYPRRNFVRRCLENTTNPTIVMIDEEFTPKLLLPGDFEA